MYLATGTKYAVYGEGKQENQYCYVPLILSLRVNLSPETNHSHISLGRGLSPGDRRHMWGLGSGDSGDRRV